MDLFSSDLQLGLLKSDHDLGDILFDFNDVLYSDVDISTLSRLSPTPTLTEDESTSPMPTLKSPWSESDSGVSDTGLLSDYCNEVSPTESCPLKPELNYIYNQRVDQGWLLDNNNSNSHSDSVNSSNYRPAAKLSLNFENQYLKEKEHVISNYINSVERKCNKSKKVSMLPSGTLPIKVINQTSTINSGILESTDESMTMAANVFCCPEKENNLGSNISPATKQEKPRAVSPSQNINEVDKSRKNALQAKLNREKKKAYTKGLEEELAKLKNQNQKLKCENDTFKLQTAELQTEVEYLKSVLANSSALSALLKNIGNTNGLKLSSTITNRKRKFDSATATDTFEGNAKKTFTAGVCLHVSDSHASLEFCAHCSSMAQISYDS